MYTEQGDIMYTFLSYAEIAEKPKALILLCLRVLTPEKICQIFRVRKKPVYIS